MELKDRIIKYILGHAPVSMTDLVSAATSKGFTEQEVLQALTGIDKDKRITVTANASGEVMYKLSSTKAKPAPSTSHLEWLRAHYPWPSSDWVEPFPEIDIGHIFLRTLEERQAYQAQVKGMPLHMLRKHHAR